MIIAVSEVRGRKKKPPPEVKEGRTEGRHGGNIIIETALVITSR